MKFILSTLSWKVILRLSIITLLTLIILNFYNLYNNSFHFFKIDNYIFPILTIPHFVYLYVISFKIREQEGSDPQMRILEYFLYGLFIVYMYKFSTIIGLFYNKTEYANYDIPDTFNSVGILMIVIYYILLALTLITFIYRKEKIGAYDFKNFN